jgi:hypothetical protein
MMGKISQAILFFMVTLFSVTAAITINVPGDYPTIQDAIIAATNGDEVAIADGIYSGEGNYNIDFMGKAITVRSADGNPESCIIDIQGEFNGISQRGFMLYNGEDSNSVIRDLTIINGVADGP